MRLLDIIYVIVLGIVEGITEWLPISSTAHLIIFGDALDFMRNENVLTDRFMEMFNVVIQLGAILAIVVFYFKKLTKLKFNIWFKIIIATIPSAIVGLLFDEYIDLIFYNLITISITLIAYGIIFLVLEKRRLKTKYYAIEDLSVKNSFKIGLFQTLAIIPGTSRSGSTILGGMFLGFDRSTSALISFFLAIPMMIGASGLKGLKFLKIEDIVDGQIVLLLIGFASAFVVSLLVVKRLMKYLKTHDFKLFAYYRIVLGFIILIKVLLYSIRKE